MVSTFTTNKSLEKPGNGDYVDTWNVPVNGDLDIIDQSLGGVTSFNATAGSATLVDTEYRSLIFLVSGAIAAPVTYTFPSGIGGQWIVRNTTTDSSGGPHALTFASAGGGTSVVIDRNVNTTIFSDGTNIRATTTPVPGSNTQVIFNSSGAFGASANMTWDGSVLTASAVADSIGNLRLVPANSQTSAYVLVATDNGKFVTITTGGVTVPSGVFSTGQSVTIYNNSGTNQTITQGGGTTMYLVGTATTGNRTLAQRGLCTIFCVASNTFVITGGGIT